MKEPHPIQRSVCSESLSLIGGEGRVRGQTSRRLDLPSA
jgi:hypothetical protein